MHFRTLLNPPELASPMCYAEPYIEIYYLGAEFSLVELDIVLNKTKRNKAPVYDRDRITFEFYKKAPREMLIQLIEIFNVVYRTGKIPISFKA